MAIMEKFRFTWKIVLQSCRKEQRDMKEIPITVAALPENTDVMWMYTVISHHVRISLIQKAGPVWMSIGKNLKN